MIKHCVMWKLKEESIVENRAQMVRLLRDLVGVVPTLVSMEVSENHNPNESAADVVLLTTHASWDDLKSYAEHPAHQKVAQQIRSFVEGRWVVDFELP